MNSQQIIQNHLLQKINDNKVHAYTLKSKKIFGFWSSTFPSTVSTCPSNINFPSQSLWRGGVGTEESPGAQARSEMLQHSLLQLSHPEIWEGKLRHTELAQQVKVKIQSAKVHHNIIVSWCPNEMPRHEASNWEPFKSFHFLSAEIILSAWQNLHSQYTCRENLKV